MPQWIERALLLWLFVTSPVLAALPSAGPATTRASAVEPWRPAPNHARSIDLLLSPGVAPCALHVDGIKFPLAHGTPLTARYNWNFGDPGGAYNALPGFNAAHMYDGPGRYTVTLTVTDEAGTVDTANASIVILPDRRHTLFISPGGSDFNVGTSVDAPLHSLGKALSLKNLPDDSEILLKAGAVYSADNTLKINRSDMMIGRYGDGLDPVLLLSKQEGNKAPHGFISIDGKCNGVTIEHITFDSPYSVLDTQEAPKIGLDAIVARGRNITVRDCTFLNVDCAVNANGSPMGLLVEHCKAPLKTGLRAYMVWTQGSDFVCLGNTAANSTREHIVRLSGVDRALIADNNFTNLDRRPADKYDTSKGTIEMHSGSYAYIAHNTVADGTIRIGPLGLHEDPSTATDWAVIESNTLVNTYIVAYPGAHHAMIRNNIIRNNMSQAIVLQGPDKDGRSNGDFHILNNTAIDNGQTGAFMKVWGHVNGIEMKNNLLVAPNLKIGVNGAAVVNTSEANLSSFTAIGHNVWPTFDGGGEFVMNGRTVSWADWAAFPQVKADAIAAVSLDDRAVPAPGSAVDGRGESLSAVCFDHDGHGRSSRVTAGAMEVALPSTAPAAQTSRHNK